MDCFHLSIIFHLWFIKICSNLEFIFLKINDMSHFICFSRFIRRLSRLRMKNDCSYFNLDFYFSNGFKTFPACLSGNSPVRKRPSDTDTTTDVGMKLIKNLNKDVKSRWIHGQASIELYCEIKKNDLKLTQADTSMTWLTVELNLFAHRKWRKL